MSLVKCVRTCWDSQLTKQYFPGDIADYPLDHVFISGKIKCFEPINPEDLRTSQDDLKTQIKQLLEVVANLNREIKELKKIRPDELLPEEKRPVGRPPKNG